MFTQALTVLALSATTAFAHPQKHHKFHHKPSGSGLPGTDVGTAPTGGYYPAGNSTGLFPTGSASSFGTSVPLVTVTVSPIPASPISSADTSSSTESSQSLAASGSGSDAGACGGTVTSTTVAYFTVTVGGSGNSSAATAATSGSSPVETGSGSGESPVESAPTDSGFNSTAPSLPISTEGPKVAPSAAPSSASGGAFYQPSSSDPISVYLSSTTSSGSSSPTGASGSSGMAGSKRGLVYNDAALTQAFADKGMTWAYNWAASAGGSLASGLDYVPQLWGSGSTGSWNPSGAKELLSFNEPDQPSQANMDPGDAAKLHIQYMNPHASSSVRIGSPAITNGNGRDSDGRYWGLDWMSQFMDACNGGCKIDFLAFHWYGDASQADYFKSHVNNVTTHAQQWGIDKIWLTEFQPSGSAQQQADFLSEVLPWMDNQGSLERYAYFMLENGNLVTGDAPSVPVGNAYCA
ncbi:MAG: hypothetical protein Q9227_006513 [Pyrenula ochraceoflavens]